MLILSIEAQNIFIIGLLLFLAVLSSIQFVGLHKKGRDLGVSEGKVGVKNHGRVTVRHIMLSLVSDHKTWDYDGEKNFMWPQDMVAPRFKVLYHHINGYCVWDTFRDLPVGFWVDATADEQNSAYLFRDMELLNNTEISLWARPHNMEVIEKVCDIWKAVCPEKEPKVINDLYPSMPEFNGPSTVEPIHRDTTATMAKHWDATDTAPAFTDRLRESFANKIVSAFEYIAEYSSNRMTHNQRDTIRQAAISSMWEGGALESMQPCSILEHWVDVKLATYLPSVHAWPGAVGSICHLIIT